MSKYAMIMYGRGIAAELKGVRRVEEVIEIEEDVEVEVVSEQGAGGGAVTEGYQSEADNSQRCDRGEAGC